MHSSLESLQLLFRIFALSCFVLELEASKMAACNLHGNNTANCILGCCKEDGNTGYEVCCSLPLQSYLWILVAAILCVLLAVVPYCWRTRCHRAETRQGRERLAEISRGTPQRGFSVAVVFTVTAAKECYNRMLAESQFQCEYGCCGEQYKQQCCNFTLHIIGTVIGLVIFLAVVTSVTYYCCRKKSHHGGSTFRSLLVRFGISPNPNTTTVATVNNIRPPGLHHFRGIGRHYGSPQGYGPMPPGYIPLPSRLPQGQHQLYGGAEDPAYPTSLPFVSPTNPLPPSYSFEPPHVYFVPMRMPPPPAYDSITHLNPAFKNDDNGGTMPTPSM